MQGLVNDQLQPGRINFSVTLSEGPSHIQACVSPRSSSCTLFDKEKEPEEVSNRPNSVEEVEETMDRMDKLFKTSFSKWIRSENNLAYVCSFKGAMILNYINEDPQSAMFALEWMIHDWSVESVAELVLKLFYSHRVNSLIFSTRLFALVHSWPLEKLAELFPIILIGESVLVTSSFFAAWLQVSGWNVDKMADIVIPIIASFKWNPAQMSEFLMEVIYYAYLDDSSSCG
jgi:hypothetical protein